MDTPDDPAGDGHQSEPGRDDNDPLITKHEIAARLGGDVTPDTVIRCWRAWGLHPVKIGRELRFRESDIRAMIKRHEI